MKPRLIITLISLIVVIVSCSVPNSDSKQNDTCIVSDTCKLEQVSSPDYTDLHILVDTIIEAGHYYLHNLRVAGYDDRVIFEDTTKWIDSLKHICYNDSVHYLLLYDHDPITYRNLWVISFVKNRWIHSDCILGNRILDLDQDGIFEVVGIYSGKFVPIPLSIMGSNYVCMRIGRNFQLRNLQTVHLMLYLSCQ